MKLLSPPKKKKNNLPLCVTPWLFDISLQMCRERKRKNHKRKSINERGENTNQINQHIKSARDLIFFFFFFFYPINQRLIIFLKPHAITKEKRDKFARYLCFVWLLGCIRRRSSWVYSVVYSNYLQDPHTHHQEQKGAPNDLSIYLFLSFSSAFFSSPPPLFFPSFIWHVQDRFFSCVCYIIQ